MTRVIPFDATLVFDKLGNGYCRVCPSCGSHRFWKASNFRERDAFGGACFKCRECEWVGFSLQMVRVHVKGEIEIEIEKD